MGLCVRVWVSGVEVEGREGAREGQEARAVVNDGESNTLWGEGSLSPSVVLVAMYR
jgi:hypothetical protein